MCLYGSRTQSGGRNFWWLKPTLNSRSWVRVAGHYHQVHLGLDNLSLVLDGSCGDPGGTLVCWDTRLEWKVEFDNPSAR